MKTLLAILTLAIASTSFAAGKGNAVVTLDGKPIDLKRLTTEEVVQLSGLILKAGGKKIQ